jgi:hypothetical protein
VVEGSRIGDCLVYGYETNVKGTEHEFPLTGDQTSADCFTSIAVMSTL